MPSPRAALRASASRASRVLDRIPEQIDAGRPFAVRGLERARRAARNSSGCSNGGSISTSAAPLLRRHIGLERRPAVDRDRLDAPSPRRLRASAARRVRLELAGDEAILRPQPVRARARASRDRLAQPAGRIEGRDARRDRARAAPRACSGDRRRKQPADAVAPFAGAARLGPAEIVEAGAGMGVDHAERCRLLAADAPGCARAPRA